MAIETGSLQHFFLRLITWRQSNSQGESSLTVFHRFSFIFTFQLLFSAVQSVIMLAQARTDLKMASKPVSPFPQVRSCRRHPQRRLKPLGPHRS